jgi:hypothetical protein
MDAVPSERGLEDRERGKGVWRVLEGIAEASGKRWTDDRGQGCSESCTAMSFTALTRVQLSVPDLRSWPRNQAIPFHLRITTTNTAFDLSTIAINFQLFQKIRVVAKGMFEDHDTVRHSSEVEEVRKGRDGKHKREEFAVDVAGDWVASSEKNGALEGEVTRVVMGTFKVGMLPSFVNGGLSCKVCLSGFRMRMC